MLNFEILKEQIGIGNLMAVGAREFTRDTPNGIMFKVGSKRGKLEKLVVRLREDDTYSVQYVRLNTKNYKFEANETLEGVYCDNIGRVVRTMGDRA